MMLRKVDFASGEYFHVYNRGAHKAKIFLNQADYERFVLLLYLTNNTEVVHLSNLDRSRTKADLFSILRPETLVDIGAYCLMPNHFHILVRVKGDGSLSTFMRKLLTGYSMFFNKKHEHSGALFQGPFKAQHVNRDEYLKYLYAYIHLNPISLRDPKWKEEGIKEIRKAQVFLESYRYSSFLDYRGEKRYESVILKQSEFPNYFQDSKDFQAFLNDWLKIKNTKDSP